MVTSTDMLGLEDLRRENEELRRFLALAPAAIVALDEEGKVRLWSGAAVTLLGWTADEVSGKPLPGVSEEEIGRWREQWSDAEGAKPFDVRWNRKDETVLDVEVTPTIERDAAGGVVRWVLSIVDVTARKRAEEAALVAARADAIRAGEDRFRRLTLALEDAIYDFDMTTDSVWRSESFERISGAPQELYADAGWWRSNLHPDDRDVAFKALDDAIAAGEETWTSEYRLKRSSGEYAILVDRGIIMRNESGRPVRIVGALADVTEKRKLEAQVRDSIERLSAVANELEAKNTLLEHEIAERTAQQENLRLQNEAIRMLSAPVVQVWDNVLALPVIGVVDGPRASEIMHKLLDEIVRTTSQFAVLDLTGMGHIDAETAMHLFDIVRAANLLGSRTLISGISPEIAKTMVDFGIEAEGFQSFGTLKDALRYALGDKGTAELRGSRGTRADRRAPSK